MNALGLTRTLGGVAIDMLVPLSRICAARGEIPKSGRGLLTHGFIISMIPDAMNRGNPAIYWTRCEGKCAKPTRYGADSRTMPVGLIRRERQEIRARSIACRLALTRCDTGGRLLSMLVQPLSALAHELKKNLVRGRVRAILSCLSDGHDARPRRGIDEEKNPGFIGIHDAQAHGFAEMDDLLVDQGHVENFHTHRT